MSRSWAQVPPLVLLTIWWPHSLGHTLHSRAVPALSMHSKRNPKFGFQYRLSLNAGQKYCSMLQGEHSTMLSTPIKLPFPIKTLVLSIFKWPLKTGFTVHMVICLLRGGRMWELAAAPLTSFTQFLHKLWSPVHSLKQFKACHSGSRRKLSPWVCQVRPELQSAVNVAGSSPFNRMLVNFVVNVEGNSPFNCMLVNIACFFVFYWFI